MYATIISCIIAVLVYFDVHPSFLIHDNGDNAEEIYMALCGTIGEAQCKEFRMDGSTGSYTFIGVDKARRTLVLQQYNKRSGKCRIEAFLNGKYIGLFDGIYEKDSSHLFKGKFISVKKDVTLDFYLSDN